MKKILSLVLVLALCLSMVACGGGNNTPDGSTPATEPVATDPSPEDELRNRALGYWKANHENGEDIPAELTFLEDGTCLVDEKQCTWTAEIGDADTIIISDGDKELYRIYWYYRNQDPSDYGLIYQHGYNYFYFNPSHYEAVEITPENLLDYFEIKERGNFITDGFGDVTSLDIITSFGLKDAYKDRISDIAESNIVFEYSYKHGKADVTIDTESKSYRVEDCTGQVFNSDVVTGRINLDLSTTATSIRMQGVSLSSDDKQIDKLMDFEFFRVTGTIYLNAE